MHKKVWVITLVFVFLLTCATPVMGSIIGDRPNDRTPDKSFGNDRPENFPQIVVTSPVSGMKFYPSVKLDVGWNYTDNCGPTVRIELVKADKIIRTLATTYPIGNRNAGQYTWEVASDLAPGNDYQIRVTSERTVEGFGFSEKFAISINPPSLLFH